MESALVSLLFCLSFLQVLAIRRVGPSIISPKLGSVLVDVTAEGKAMNDTDSEKTIPFTYNHRTPFRLEHYPETPVEEWIRKLICGGEFWAAFNLGVHYTHRSPLWKKNDPVVKFEGEPKEMEIGEQVFERKGDFGDAHAVAAVYYRPGKVNVVFQSADFIQTRKILLNSSFRIFSDEVWAESNTKIRIGSYIARKAEKLWTHYGLGDFLLKLVGGLKDAHTTFLFSGLSHGAALSQVLSLRFELARRTQAKNLHQRHRVATSSIIWNGYRVFDGKGNALLDTLLGGRIAHFIHGYLDKRRSKVAYDAVPALFKRQFEYADVRTRYVFDQFGNFRLCNNDNRCPKGPYWQSLFMFLHRVKWYHGSPVTEPSVLASVQKVAGSSKC